MRRLSFALSIVMVICFVSFASAQGGRGAGPKFYGDFKPVLGGWAEYQMTPKGGQPSKVKIAIVGMEGEAYWYETVMEDRQEGKIISKMLVSGSPDASSNIKRMIFKSGNEPVMEMPVQMMPASKPQASKGKMTDKGTESVQVPAGNFKAQRLQYQDGNVVVDTWITKEVSPYGVVKSQSADHEMVLLGHGTGAKTLITETPQKFEMPQMPAFPPKGK